jgi:flagellar biosynthesis protein FlhF
MAGALQKVKKDLGRHAVILHTRTFRKGGFLGMGGRNMVEITATEPSEDPPVAWAGTRSPGRPGESPTNPQSLVRKPAALVRTSAPSDESIRADLGTIRSLVEELVTETRQTRAASVPGELLETYTQLLQQQVAEEIARDVLSRMRQRLTGRELNDPQRVQEHLARCVAEMIPEAGPIRLDEPLGRARVVALVGPTGVGKTTTIAKLAAHFKLRDRKQVGLITIDTYRIAAVDQLKTYAKIIDVPLEVVLSPEELSDAVGRMRALDLLLVDTAGRSHNDAIRLNELKAFFDTVRPDEIHLVLSSTGTVSHLRSAVERFGVLGADRIIFTKLDEAVGFGAILAALQAVEKRLSYVTMGQDVPDDIEVGSAGDLARLIVGQEPASACLRTLNRR